MKSWLKHILKKYFLYWYIKDRFSPSVQIAQRNLVLQYRRMLQDNQIPKLSETGFRVFSQFEEDGKLLFVFSLLGESSIKTFIEFGSDDGVNSNSANLFFNHGWTGLFIDGNARAILRGKRFFSKYPHPYMFPPDFVQAIITKDNINQIISGAGYTGAVGLLSIDIDGNDYWIWDAITVVEPQVIIIETNRAFGLNKIVVPYDPNYIYPGKHPVYHGASPYAMIELGKKKGYRLVGANDLGYNFIFIKNELLEELVPEVTLESILSHPSNVKVQKEFQPIKDWEYIRLS